MTTLPTETVPEAPAEPRERPGSRRPTARRAVAVGAAATLALGLTATGSLALAHGAAVTPSAASTTAGAAGWSTQDLVPVRPDGGGTSPTVPSPTGTPTTGTTALDVTAADADESAGVVVVETLLGYTGGEAAGTGMVLTADGLVLTNNHVVEGATQVVVTVPSTGETYAAEVVGTSATADVAVLELDGADGLQTVTLDDDEDLAVGDAVTAVGNAGGTGQLVAADGTVTALGRSITTASGNGSAGETLVDLVEVDADVVSGDSGGPLLDAEGEVVGIDTAASSGTTDIVGYAVTIGDAMEVVEVILAGEETDTVTVGYPAFLGVQVVAQAEAATVPGRGGLGAGDVTAATDPAGSAGTTGAVVSGVVENTPAADAGITAGSTITAVGTWALESAEDLTAVLAELEPGDGVSVTWVDADGQEHTAAVVLVEGPAD
jgi:S1-C subfamily serine protease